MGLIGDWIANARNDATNAYNNVSNDATHAANSLTDTVSHAANAIAEKITPSALAFPAEGALDFVGPVFNHYANIAANVSYNPGQALANLDNQLGLSSATTSFSGALSDLNQTVNKELTNIDPTKINLNKVATDIGNTATHQADALKQEINHAGDAVTSKVEQIKNDPHQAWVDARDASVGAALAAVAPIANAASRLTSGSGNGLADIGVNKEQASAANNTVEAGRDTLKAATGIILAPATGGASLVSTGDVISSHTGGSGSSLADLGANKNYDVLGHVAAAVLSADAAGTAIGTDGTLAGNMAQGAVQGGTSTQTMGGKVEDGAVGGAAMGAIGSLTDLGAKQWVSSVDHPTAAAAANAGINGALTNAGGTAVVVAADPNMSAAEKWSRIGQSAVTGGVTGAAKVGIADTVDNLLPQDANGYASSPGVNKIVTNTLTGGVNGAVAAGQNQNDGLTWQQGFASGAAGGAASTAVSLGLEKYAGVDPNSAFGSAAQIATNTVVKGGMDVNNMDMAQVMGTPTFSTPTFKPQQRNYITMDDGTKRRLSMGEQTLINRTGRVGDTTNATDAIA